MISKVGAKNRSLVLKLISVLGLSSATILHEISEPEKSVVPQRRWCHITNDFWRTGVSKENWVISIKYVPVGILIPPNHYLNQCWHLIDDVLWHLVSSQFKASAQTTFVRHQAIIWTSAGLLSIETHWTDFIEILIRMQTFSFRKMHLKISFRKWLPFCLCLSVLTMQMLCCQGSLTNMTLCEISMTKAWIGNSIGCFICDVITHPCHDINGNSAKRPLWVGHGLIIITWICEFWLEMA